MRNFKENSIFTLLQQIPKGKITTYKILAAHAGIKNPRTVGTIIHKNTDSKKYPCHRVIRSDGTVAEGYAFGGQKKQIEILKKEGITFSNNKINIQQYIFIPLSS